MADDMRTLLVGSSPRLAVSVAGAGDLVIFVHGMGGDRTSWYPQLRALQHDFTCASVDLRGYGDSDRVEGPLDFRADFAADLLAVMDHWQVRSAHLVGLSMGGRVARWAALLHSQRVASLTLANTSPGFDALGVEETARFVAARSFTPIDNAMPEGYGRDQAVKMMAAGAPQALIEHVAAPFRRLSASHYLEVLRASAEQDRGARLEDIRCPVLVVTSDADPVYPQEVARRMLQRLPDGRLACISGAGHLSNVEKPKQFNSVLKAFLSSHRIH